MRRTAVFSAFLLLVLAFTLVSKDPHTDPRLRKASRAPQRGGWIQVHLEGTPNQIGFQHGYLLSAEIKDNFDAISTEMMHEEKRDWNFFRNVAEKTFWPRVPQEYRDEIDGIVEGVRLRNVKLDRWDIVALNAWLEQPYYDKWYDKLHGKQPTSSGVPEHCSAFVATGSYTKDGRIVIAHNNWTSYSSGERWNIVFDIVPTHGYRFIMDGAPGLIHSGDDFGINSAGIAITETTISEFNSFTPEGVPEFVRARKAMQYSASIDDFARIMKEGNTGGYANNWLIADRKNNEVASLELGLKHVILQRTRDGFFVGSNFPADPELTKDETSFDPNDKSLSGNARHIRWLTLMQENKGKIDIAAGEKFLADHYDTYEGKIDPDERTLDGHIDLSPRGSHGWVGPYAPVGAVQNKIADAASMEKLSFTAALGHACGLNFKAASQIAHHPEFAWWEPILHDMDAHPWTKFTATK